MTDKLDEAIMKMVEDEFTKVQHKWMDEGKLVRGGFAVFAEVMWPKMTDAQQRILATTFVAGAEYMFTSLMALMTANREPTEEDERRLQRIHGEMQEFRAHMRNVLDARNEDEKEARDKKKDN